MGVINQPRVTSLGNVLCDYLTNNPNCTGSKFYIISAYAKKTGIDRIQSSIEQFRQRGGTVIGIIGLDQHITTIQALQKLHDITDELYVYHSKRLAQTFHPKIYVIETPPNHAVVFIGSSNLTFGGLYSNYEATYQKEYNLALEEDSTEFSHIKQLIESYKNTTSPCCKLVTRSLLTNLIRQDYLANEEVTIAITPLPSRRTQYRPIFGVERFTPPQVRITREESRLPEAPSIPRINHLREGFWKTLRPFDVSATSAPGQILIPIRFVNLFPIFSEQQTTAVNAMQADAFFNIIFVSPLRQRIRVDSVRIIHYIPAPSHPRPNQELRFTFRSPDIFEQLEAGDILEFRRTTNPDIWFQIRQLKPSTSTHRRLSARGRFGFIES